MKTTAPVWCTVLALFLSACVGHHSYRAVPPNVTTSLNPSWSVAAWYLDPSATLTCSSDTACNGQSATCAGAGACPFKTWTGGVLAQWGTDTPVEQQATTVHLLSDEPTPSNDVWSLDLTRTAPTNSLTIVGTPITVTTATIGTYTAQNISSGTLATITASGQSGSYWSTACGGATCVGLLVQDTTTPGWFWIESDLGSATAAITQPYTSTMSAQVTPVNGDALTVLRGPRFAMSRARSTAVGATQFSLVTIQGANPNPGAFFEPITNNEPFFFDRVRFEGSITSWDLGYLNNSVFSHSVALSSTQVGTEVMTGGAVLSCHNYINGSRFFPTALLGGVVLDSSPCASGVTFIGQIELGNVFSHGVLNVDGQSSFASMQGTVEIAPNTFDFTNTQLWGPGNMALHQGSSMYIDGTAANQMKLTGGFTIDSATTAFPWSSSTHTYGAAVAITGANVDSNGSLSNPQTGTRISLNP